MGKLRSRIVGDGFVYINFTGFPPLSLMYLISMGVAIINVSLIVFVFGFRTQDGESLVAANSALDRFPMTPLSQNA